MTPSLKYYNIEDVSFEFNSPVGNFWSQKMKLAKKLTEQELKDAKAKGKSVE